MSPMHNTTCRVSVIIPTYNSVKFITEALASVIGQTYRPYEVIVVDDGSTDETKEVVLGFHDDVKYLYQKNQGPASARNSGIKMSTGDYIAFLDADDVWTPNKIEDQVEFLDRHHDIGLVFSEIESFGEGLSEKENSIRRVPFVIQMYGHQGASQIPLPKAYKNLLITNFISTPVVMARRECFELVGLFDERLRIVEDRDMWLRIAAHFNIAFLPSVHCKRRLHQFNTCKDSDLATSSLIKVLEKHVHLFPALAPRSLIKKKLSRLYVSVGYMLLLKNRRREARQMALHSLSLGKTIKAFELIPLTFMGQALIQCLRRIKRGVLRTKR